MARNCLTIALCGGAAAMGGARVSRAATMPVHVDTGVAIYSDDTQTQVLTPHARAGATAAPGLDLEAGWTADVISSASPDVISAATDRMAEVRNEMALSGVYDPGGTSVRAGYVYSTERDSQSHVVQIGGGREFLDKAVELGLAYAVSWNATGLADEPSDRWRSVWIHSAEAGVTYILDKYTELEGSYAPFVAVGYQANPYRRIPIGGGDQSLLGAVWVEENVPRQRIRHALSARVRRALGMSWVAAGSYRFYTDDWDVRGHTVELGAFAELGHGLVVAVRDRFSVQGAAYFYRERYEQELRFRSRDRRLAPMLANLGGGAVSWQGTKIGPLARVMARVGLDAVTFRHDDYFAVVPDRPGEIRPLGWIAGYIVQVGLEVAP